ncbi:uncharacterized protein PV07_11043 [Cladophialophora immunda]|uniref:RapZ C-terminal domain-containing protein n=1 Tax=Cladophialophora immunda TaxID=569365 RepID=A0A0D2AD32_9EURO|nr:uncharacterized protein PV07_11043 [Cladophialophora immunda]KIW22777.1 hypothetical protein PV07_11043 [Cladophialophora immunda]OQU93997.1 hypothetical protein CLAIMM_00422 [Cladophialophora immunda]
MEDSDSQASVSETEVSPTAVNTGPPGPNFELVIISYGHAKGPLTLPAESGSVERLTFSVRDIKNPPARLRRTHTGLSSHLRKEVMANQAADARLNFIVEAVRTKMGEMKLAHERGSTSTETPLPSRGQSTLVVGIMCERGKHRSVAFAEELSRKIQADNSWVVSVQHRELGLLPDGKGAVIGDENILTGGGQAGDKPKTQRHMPRKKGRSSDRRFAQEAVPDVEEDT